ncbi:MAG: MGMT family protein [Planctomycetes bacterium]|nr:MGMT family protein [Planctomycetota bacterium]
MPYDPTRHGPHRVVGPGFHAQVHRLVQRIPRGRVASYGDIAEALGLRSAARRVGQALAALPAGRAQAIPWHRVVNAAGRISVRADGEPSPEQARLLREEGIEVDDTGRVLDFSRHRHRHRSDRGQTPS